MLSRVGKRMDLRYMGWVDNEAVRVKMAQGTLHSHYWSERFGFSVSFGLEKLSL